MFEEIYQVIVPLLIFFGIPLIILIWFIISLVKYVKARKDEACMAGRKMALVSLLLSSFFILVLIAFFILALIALVILFSMDIAHM